MRSAVEVFGLLALVCSGCGFKSQQVPGDGVPPIDAPAVDAPLADAALDAPVDAIMPDGPPDGPPPCQSFSQQLDTCSLMLTGDLTLSAASTYSTDSHILVVNGTPVSVTHQVVATHGDLVDAILLHDLRLETGITLRATGARPLAIIASGVVALADDAAIDVSDGGAGVLANCSSPPGSGGNNSTGAGGGGGGAYGSAGGDGGPGHSAGPQAPGGTGANSIGLQPGPHGGCPGARGGVGASGAMGTPGKGGGAIYIVAAGGITLGVSA